MRERVKEIEKEVVLSWEARNKSVEAIMARVTELETVNLKVILVGFDVDKYSIKGRT